MIVSVLDKTGTGEESSHFPCDFWLGGLYSMDELVEVEAGEDFATLKTSPVGTKERS